MAHGQDTESAGTPSTSYCKPVKFSRHRYQTGGNEGNHHPKVVRLIQCLASSFGKRAKRRRSAARSIGFGMGSFSLSKPLHESSLEKISQLVNLLTVRDEHLEQHVGLLPSKYLAGWMP